MLKIKSCALGICLTALSLSSLTHAELKLAPVTDSLQKVVEDYYKKYSKKEKFTAVQASVLIPQSQGTNQYEVKTAFTGTFGLPPISKTVSADSLFDIGSITKSFTALILLQLQAEGQLSLDDHLGKWLPQYPNWREVTLRQLLNMTSGIPNYSEDDEFSKKMEANLSRAWTDEELLSYAHPEKPLPKHRKSLYEYCNSNYILAGMVIEKVTGDAFANQLKLRIINAKNGLNHSYYPAGPEGQATQKAISSQKVHGYYFDEKTQKLQDTFDNNLSWAGAAGAIVANTQDVVQWVQLLYHGTLIDAAHRAHALAELESVVSMKTGLPIPTVSAEEPTGFGLGVGYYYDKELQQKFWVYKGSTLGFRTMYFWQPCNNVTTVVALNSKGGEGNPDSKLGDKILSANLKLYKLIIKSHPELKCTP
ncbi:beta-lactamase family protein [Legionella lytica]|uniref:Beta-lactamase family protein n=1 Tax=Legionella lytica TaxID=96232 RepID=A0ABY4Y663_9GAMM|nr:serine hydrolase domain-containing protein [Legionella lytica]USQ13123.1 beta-lactamase family protein [Legionella lytica]